MRQPAPRPATPQAVTRLSSSRCCRIRPHDRLSVGFPGVVVDGVIHSAPNLHKTWAGFNLQQALASSQAPVRVLNDAGIQGLGVIAGRGVELVLTLGTGMGFALFVEGRYVPNLEMAHHPSKGTHLRRVGRQRRAHRSRQPQVEQTRPPDPRPRPAHLQSVGDLHRRRQCREAQRRAAGKRQARRKRRRLARRHQALGLAARRKSACVAGACSAWAGLVG